MNTAVIIYFVIFFIGLGALFLLARALTSAKISKVVIHTLHYKWSVISTGTFHFQEEFHFPKNSSRFSLLLLIILLLCSIHNSALAQQISAQPQILKSASELDYPPFALVRPDGTADGFSVELLKAVVLEIGMEVDIPVGLWHEIKQKLADGELDVLPLVAYSVDREKIYDFTVPYLQMHGTIFVRKGEVSMKSQADLKDKEVLVMRGDAAHEYAVDNNISKHLVLTEDYAEAFTLLSEGKHDAVVAQYLMGLQLMQKLGITNVVSVADKGEKSLKLRSRSGTHLEQKFCFAVPEGNQNLLADLNEGLAIIFNNGTYESLYNKWFTPILPVQSATPAQITRHVIFTLVPILFLLTVFTIWYLRREVARKTGSLKQEIEVRKKTESLLRQYEIIVSNSSDMMALMDKQYRFVTVNKAYLEAFKLSLEQIIGKNAADILGNDFFDAEVKHHADQCLAGNEVRFQNLTDLPAYGTRYIDITYSPYHDVDKNITGYVVIGRDITDQKNSEIALSESRDRFRTLFQNAPLSYQSLDENGCIIEVNDTWLEHLGYSRDEVTGKSFGDFLTNGWKDHFKENFPRFKAIGEILGVEFEMIKKDGSKVLMSINGKISRNANGSFMQTHCVLQDISRQRILEEHLRQSQKMEAIGTMAGGIAHDFNNIMAIILGNTEMALDDIPVGNPAVEYIDEIVLASDRGKELVKQILSFSRKEKKELISIHPQSLISETLKLLRSTTPTTISIVQSISQDCGRIKADPTGLHQILMNLFTNGVQSMEEKGEITVNLQEVNLERDDFADLPPTIPYLFETPGEYACLSVTDTGAGMDEETVTRIFDPFYTTKEVGKGTGMGLSVVHGIVESHGGFMVVDSEPGRGSTFHVFFPITEEEEEEFVETVTISPQTGTERILFIDDEEALLVLGKRILDKLGYEVTAENSSLKALEIFKSAPDQFDLIITDQAMPNMSGTELAAEIVKVRPDIPVILCSGFSSKVSEENAREKGISKYINKPYDKKMLAMAIREVLDDKV